MKKYLYFASALFVAMLVVLVGCDQENPVTLDGKGLSGDEYGQEGSDINFSWDPGGWQNAIILEAKYALSTRKDGTSSQTLVSGKYFGGDLGLCG